MLKSLYNSAKSILIQLCKNKELKNLYRSHQNILFVSEYDFKKYFFFSPFRFPMIPYYNCIFKMRNEASSPWLLFILVAHCNFSIITMNKLYLTEKFFFNISTAIISLYLVSLTSNDMHIIK